MTAVARWRGGWVKVDTENDRDREARLRFMHPCAAPSCEQWVMQGYVACGSHWRRLPADERTTLAEAFRVREQAPDVYELAVERMRRLLGAL